VNGTVYKIVSPSGKVYVGSSKDIKRRLYQYSIYNCGNQTKLFSSLTKYGYEAHKVSFLWHGKLSEMYKMEREYGIFYNVLNRHLGLNLKLPDDCGQPFLVSDEVGRKISEAKRGKCAGRKNSFYNKKHTEETKTKIREKYRENPLIGEKNPNYGKKWPQDRRKKQSEILRAIGYRHSKKTRKKMSKVVKERYRNGYVSPTKGKKYTDERRKSISERIRINGNPRSKLVIDLQYGIFYRDITEAANVYGFERKSLSNRLNGRCKNRTNLRIA
jgi:group I intron endonuclease